MLLASLDERSELPGAMRSPGPLRHLTLADGTTAATNQIMHLGFRSPLRSCRRVHFAWLVLLFSIALLLGRQSRAGAAPAEVRVILWFDTEDFLLPADDEATLRLCEMLSARGIRATFKLVGEKARVLESRGRQDVLTALRRHDIGFHSNWHSVHPTPSEYLCEAGFLDGIAEFVRREGQGAADVRRILHVPTLSCYGQPGSSWASQAIAALSAVGVAPEGVPCYVDEGTHVGLDGKPFWFAGALNVYHMAPNYTRMELHDPEAVKPGKERFTEIAERLAKQSESGLISIFYHPCEWVHREFWDGVNFLRGQNPPRSEWKPPGQRSREETEGAFRRFGDYLDHIRSTPGVRFVTASDLPGLYPDLTRTEGASNADLVTLSERILSTESRGLSFQLLNGKAFSVADQLQLLTQAVGALSEHRAPLYPLRTSGVLGPAEQAARTLPAGTITWNDFRSSVLDVQDFLRHENRIPSRVQLGADAVAPAVFLGRLAFVFAYQQQFGSFAGVEGMAIPSSVSLAADAYVAQDTPGVFGGWVIHRSDFRAPRILEIARLQAWTLKPALAGRRN